MKVLVTLLSLSIIFVLLWHKPEINLLHGTVIVIVLSPRCVVIGADSRGTYYNTNGEKQFLELCKIKPIGEYYYAIAGFYNSTRIDLKDILEKELINNKDFDMAVQKIKKEATDVIFNEFKYLKEHQPKLFRERTEKGIMITEIAIVGLRHSKPFAQIIGVNIANKETCEMSNNEKLDTLGNKVLYLGETKHIIEAMKDYEKNGTKYNEPSFAHYLLDLEIKGGDSSIGYPVDILEINPKGKKWHKKKSNCPE